MVEIPPLGFGRGVMLLRHLDSSIPPPSGYASWDEYWRLFLKGEGTVLLSSPGTIPRGNKLSLVWTRTDEDVATVGMHFAHLDGTDVVDFAEDDRETIEGHALTFWNNIKSAFDPSLVLDRLVWHEWGVGVRRPNPSVRDIAAGSIAGGNDVDAQLPPQVATSVTFKTARRRTWGRIFLPASVVESCVAGRLATDYQTLIRNGAGTLLDAAAGAGLPLVIWSPRRTGGALKYGKKTEGGVVVDHHDLMDDDPDTSSFAMTVDSIQVDDIFDVMESRRYDKPLSRLTHTLG